MSFPVAEFLENLARQVLQLQVNLNSSSRDDPPVQQLAVSQTCSSCFKSSEDKGIIDARKGTHSPRIAVNQACLIIDDIPDNSFIDSASLKSPCTPRAFSPAAGRTHGRSATGTTGILDGILTIGQYAGVLLGGMDLRSLPEAPGGESSGDTHPVKRMDEDAAEVLPPAGGEAESVSIDTVGGGLCVYTENGTELRCLSMCGQLFDSHSLEVPASPRDAYDQGSSTHALLPPTTMGRASSSPLIGIDESFRFAFANF